MIEDICEHYYGTKSDNRKQKTAHELAESCIEENKKKFWHSHPDTKQ